ncbi:E3 ubiquitin-protein ligase UBR2 [Rhincodon typus]|uniref:E3 ubiquitin-protein ligase UBR2 n=1 Tax=Rhincodon typus TaxID=259920 RepID=UPI00202F1515|nr:E3 ubiquitin-protein ligase UBR2 [Rhincodon typus]
MAATETEEVPAIPKFLMECSAKDVALNWLQATDLNRDVYQHLAYYVPKIYCRGSNPNPLNEEMLAQHILLGPMEWYLCGEDPAVGIRKLEKANKSSQLCGHVFKIGEPTYSCRDCAVDPTCVLCMECFLASVHRAHRYRMTTSGGGGFCDCGDTEAWKQGPSCLKHEPTVSGAMEEDPLAHLSEDMVGRAYEIFAIAFKYAVDMLTWVEEDRLPAGLEPLEKEDTYYCMLFNDEVHTYEQVIYTLQKAVNCTQKEAVSFATTVDRDGRRSVRYGDFQFCEQAKTVIVRNTSRQTKPLKVQVMHSSVVAHQNFAIKVLIWLSQVIGYSGGLRRILCEVGLQQRSDEDSSSLVDRLMLCDSKLWKAYGLLQGMDPVTRQVGQHIEMEPEWEAAFTLQIKLTHIISMIQEWCASDERVLIEAYRKCLIVLLQCHNGPCDGEQPITLSMCGHTLESVQYRVSQHQVSIHLPVSRLFSGLHVLLSKTEVAYKFPELLPLSELSPPLLIEHPLHCMVLCAQVHAGMWRRNGFSLVNQIYYYHNVKCRVEMYDKDLIMLQAGASMMDPNHFLMIMLCRFELYHIFNSPDYGKRFNSEHTNKDVLQQNNTLIEEMLHLIMMVVGERYTAGVGQVSAEDELKREIVHQLCIKPMAHSELVKALPEDENKETGMEKVIESVASFKKPGLTGRGLYELKPECAKEFNVFFYHYSRADQSKAEEAQRKLRKQNGEDMALPPPVLPHFCPLFASLVNVLQSDVFVYILRTVLQWVVEPNGHAWTESMLQRVLHLIGMALNEEKQQMESASADSDVTFNFTSKFSCPGEAPENTPSILAMLESLQNSPHLEVYKDMIKWILKLFGIVKKMRERSNLAPIVETEGHGIEECSRDKDKADRKRKAEIARLRREKILAQMSEMQRHFIDENRELFQQTLEELEASSSTVTDNSPIVPDAALIALGPRQTRVFEEKQVVTCILCQEEQEIRMNNKAMVLASFVQRSTVLSKNRTRTFQDPENHDPLFMPPDLACGTHIGSCGHIMHAHCWQSYFDAVQAKEQRRQQRLRVHTSYDVENGEFLCPLCECLSNTVIPLLPSPRNPLNSDSSKNNASVPVLSSWLKRTLQQLKVLKKIQEKQTDNLSNTHLEGMEVPEGFQPDVKPKNPFSESIKGMLTTLATATYKVGLKVHPNEQDPRVPMMCRGSCAYTVQAIERFLADEEKPLFGPLPCRQDDCLKALTRFAASQWTVSSLSVVQKQYARLLSVLIPDDDKTQISPSILDVDMFHLLVSLVLSYPALHCQDFTGVSLAVGHLHLFHLVTTAHIVQILLTSSTEENTMDQESADGDEEAAALTLYDKLRQYSGSALNSMTSGWHLWQYIKTGIIPYLRCSALFFHYLNNVPAPVELQENGPHHFELLCRYLSLPTNLMSLFKTENDTIDPLIQRWCGVAEVQSFVKGERTAISYPREPNKLIELPDDYSCLINRTSCFTCPKSGGDKSRAPTLCLVCGGMLCSQSYCCQTELEGEDVGACTAHTYTCGCGVGIFLRVRESQILFLAGKTKGCFYPPPYLDDYGETDQGLRRGNPLHLCKERYRKLQKLWQQHSITEEIGHAQEANQTLVGIDWQHL